MTESQIKELGWKFVEQYNHDQYHTNRYKLGCLEVEFTYENKELLTCDLTISELNCMPISFNQAKMLTELLGHWSDSDEDKAKETEAACANQNIVQRCFEIISETSPGIEIDEKVYE